MCDGYFEIRMMSCAMLFSLYETNCFAHITANKINRITKWLTKGHKPSKCQTRMTSLTQIASFPLQRASSFQNARTSRYWFLPVGIFRPDWVIRLFSLGQVTLSLSLPILSSVPAFILRWKIIAKLGKWLSTFQANRPVKRVSLYALL